MNEGLIDSAAQAEAQSEQPLYGVSPAHVVNNVDSTGKGRVQVHLPWLPGVEPWARVAVPMAGAGRGMFFLPQVGDEVLVAFMQGDVRQPYVIGSLWNGTDRPPSQEPGDAVSKRLIRTPSGHEMLFDEQAQSVSITAASGQTITLDSDKIELASSGGAATVALDTAGSVTIRSSTSIALDAPSISLDGKIVSVKGSASASIDGGLACEVKAAVVKIN